MASCPEPALEHGARAGDLRHLVSALQPDVVHLHSFFPGVLGRMRSLPGDPRVVYQPHSWAFDAVSNEALARAVARWERHAATGTDVTVTNCQEELAEARTRRVDGNAMVIGLPVDVDFFRPGDPSAARAALGIDAARVITCVGRLSRQKNQEQLAAAWEAAPIPDTVLALVGPGSQDAVRAAAPTTADRSLRLVGPTDDVRTWLQASDIAVLPSLYEGQSVSMAEALSCGVPVVMTQVNGASEMVAPVGEAPAGAVVPVGAMRELLAECATRLADPPRMAAEGVAARRRAVTHFRAETVMARLLEAYTPHPDPVLQRESQRP
ncbi:glycosyltransferase [Nocardioides mesophilus]|uniref:glycosyltransferase n=1 Tax=Nocardioides mesophilus TaxID=433659 RepID=UPI0031B637D6